MDIAHPRSDVRARDADFALGMLIHVLNMRPSAPNSACRTTNGNAASVLGRWPVPADVEIGGAALLALSR